MAVFRESSRTRRKKKKAARRARERDSSKQFRGGVVRSNLGRKSNRKKTTTIAKVMLATEFGKKQGGIQKIGSAIIEQKFSGEEEGSRSWNDLLDPFGVKAFLTPQGAQERRPPPLHDQLGRAVARPGAKRSTIIPTAGSTKLINFLGRQQPLGKTSLWHFGQSTKGGGDTGTQLMLNIMDEVHYAVYIDNRLISVLDSDSYEQFMRNMKRNLQLRTRALRSD